MNNEYFIIFQHKINSKLTNTEGFWQKGWLISQAPTAMIAVNKLEKDLPGETVQILDIKNLGKVGNET